MSVNPVAMLGLISDVQSPNLHGRAEQAAISPGSARAQRSISGTELKPEDHSPKREPLPVELPQDEVQVQRDEETNGEIVIKYMDHSGNVILQVPSSQVLGMKRLIGQDFRKAAEARTNAAEAPGRGEKEIS